MFLFIVTPLIILLGALFVIALPMVPLVAAVAVALVVHHAMTHRGHAHGH